MPKDQYVNTFHFFGAPAVTAVEAQKLVTAVTSFYDTVNVGSGKSVLDRIATIELNVTGRQRFKVYDLEQPSPRVPVLDVTPASTLQNVLQQLPTEVAVCLSYSGAPQAGGIAARRRGRIFVGPLNVSTLMHAPDGHCRPATLFSEDLRLSGKRLRSLASQDGWTWCVLSSFPQGQPLEFDGDRTQIDRVSTDDAFDTQRRRGIAPLGRIQIVVP